MQFCFNLTFGTSFLVLNVLANKFLPERLKNSMEAQKQYILYS